VIKGTLLVVKNLVFLAVIFSTLPSAAQSPSAPVWSTDNSWLGSYPGTNETYEQHYAKWIRENVNKTILTEPGSPLYDKNDPIKVDCAKSVYALRMLYAYENHLPFVVSSDETLGERPHIIYSNEKNIGHTNLDPDQRFRIFLRQVLGYINTTTLARDTFSLNISPDYVTSGKIMLYYKKDDPSLTRHAHTVYSVSASGVPTILSATIKLEAQNLTVMKRILQPPYTGDDDGYRGWRLWGYDQQRGYYLIPLQETPGTKEYANTHGEVFTSQSDRTKFPREILKWSDSISEFVGITRQDPKQELKDLTDSLCDKLTQQREGLVEDAQKEFEKNNNQCASESQWDRLSTVSLDEKIWELFQAVDAWVKESDPEHDDLISLNRARHDRDEQFKICTINSIDKRFDLRWVRLLYKARLPSADPNDIVQNNSYPLRRWGLSGPVDFSKGLPAEDRFPEDWPAKYEDKVISCSRCNPAKAFCPVEPSPNALSSGEVTQEK